MKTYLRANGKKCGGENALSLLRKVRCSLMTHLLRNSG